MYVKKMSIREESSVYQCSLTHWLLNYMCPCVSSSVVCIKTYGTTGSTCYITFAIEKRGKLDESSSRGRQGKLRAQVYDQALFLFLLSLSRNSIKEVVKNRRGKSGMLLLACKEGFRKRFFVVARSARDGCWLP